MSRHSYPAFIFAATLWLGDCARRPFHVRIANLSLLTLIFSTGFLFAQETATERPNILFCLSDDQSYPHASAYGEPVIKTPVFDRVA